MDRWRLYLDEVGEHKMLRPDHPKWSNLGKRYFSMTGVWFRLDDLVATIRPEMDALKREHLPYDPDAPPILHRNAIVRRRGVFSVLKDPLRAERFNRHLLQLLSRWPFQFGTFVVDKKHHAVGSESVQDVYHFCLRQMIERFKGACQSGRGDVLAEARNPNVDKILRQEYVAIYTTGTRYQGGESLRDFLTSKEIKIKPKTANVEGLQIADLIANPSHMELLVRNDRVQPRSGTFGNLVMAAVRRKWNKYAQRLI